MLGILWGIVVVLFAFWALGFALHIAGNLIHIVLIVAIALAIYNFAKSRAM
ncbi:lmo0937 family membrane protein [uncultured Nostoc sp.]|uniref:lmo0937 family membrane protein n=1 Tax=uncultured Nostoc sp. TaxID=340711 RepID=UPI00260530F5|nr:lmo0937 family membrane protein [uncultured Nostoc sp.]